MELELKIKDSVGLISPQLRNGIANLPRPNRTITHASISDFRVGVAMLTGNAPYTYMIAPVFKSFETGYRKYNPSFFGFAVRFQTYLRHKIYE